MNFPSIMQLDQSDSIGMIEKPIMLLLCYYYYVTGFIILYLLVVFIYNMPLLL